MDMRKERRRMLAYNLQWFAKDGPGGEKTEPATSKKLKEAREEGQVSKSKELTSAFDLVALFAILKFFVSNVGTSMLETFQEFYKKIPDIVSGGRIQNNTIVSLFQEAMLLILKMAAPFFIAGVAVAIVVNIIQVGWKPTAKPMKPKGNKLNPISGFKKILSKYRLLPTFNLFVFSKICCY